VRLAEPPAPEEGPILAGLVEAGYDVGSLAELRHSGVRYRKAVPIMIAALSETTDVKTLMELVRALSVPWAKPEATGPLVELFRRVAASAGDLRWAVGNALDVNWDDARFDDLLDLVRNRSYGRAREMVVLGLGRSKRPEAGDVLIALLDDPDVNGHAVAALRKLKVPGARVGLERMLKDDRAWVRKEAQRALAALGRSSGQMNAAAVPA
jgi:HEAT repeat protein